jgi:hypothetical protein
MFRTRPQTRSRRWVTGTAILLSLALTLLAASAGAQAPIGGCPPTSAAVSKGSPPSTPLSTTAGTVSPAPEQIVACVGSQSITGATYMHWATVARKSASPSKHGPSTSEVVNEVMGFLISSDWVLDEAAALNIHVSESTVRHTFDHVRAGQFPKQREFETFLRKSGQTVADLMFRVRLNLTSARIQKRVVAGHRGTRSQQRAIKRFVQEFKLKWTAQTYCEPGYATSDCGHVQAGL